MISFKKKSLIKQKVEQQHQIKIQKKSSLGLPQDTTWPADH